MYRIEALGEIVPEFAATKEASAEMARALLRDPKARAEMRAMFDDLPDDVRGEVFEVIGCSSSKGSAGKLILAGAGGALLGVVILSVLRG